MSDGTRIIDGPEPADLIAFGTLIIFVALGLAAACYCIIDINGNNSVVTPAQTYVCKDTYVYRQVPIDGGNYMLEPLMTENNTLKKCTEMLEEGLSYEFKRIK